MHYDLFFHPWDCVILSSWSLVDGFCQESLLVDRNFKIKEKWCKNKENIDIDKNIVTSFFFFWKERKI